MLLQIRNCLTLQKQSDRLLLTIKKTTTSRARKDIMKLTKGVISREEALKISPDYVAWAEGNFDKYEIIWPIFEKLKVGQKVLTYERQTKQFVLAKVSSMRMPNWEADGPIVRVSNGEYSWRVDGDKYATKVK